MDFLDVVIDTTLKGAVSYYVQKSLEKIDQGLSLLVKSGNREAIKQYVTSNQLEQPLTDLASQTLRGSFFIPAMPENIATFEDRAELFQNVLQFGYNISTKLQADLILPGSLHSRDTITIFSSNERQAPKVVREGNRVTLPKEQFANRVYFVPLKSSNAKEIFGRYKKRLVEHLEDSSGYFSYNIVRENKGWDNCRLKAITAGSCFFEYAALMEGEIQKYYEPANDKVTIKDWPGGLNEMFAAVIEVPNLRYLSSQQTKEIKDAYELFQKLN